MADGGWRIARFGSRFLSGATLTIRYLRSGHPLFYGYAPKFISSLKVAGWSAMRARSSTQSTT